MNKKPKIIAIIGPTAVGKTDMSIKLAKKFNGEIISADSRQVYKGMDIGTGKVTKKEMDGVPHYLLDVASPKKQFTVTDYKKLANETITHVLKRDKLPILTGGTGFYVDSVVDNIEVPDVSPDPDLRKELQKKDTETLRAMLRQHDRRRYNEIEKNDRTRTIRALEIITQLGKVPKKKSSKPIYENLIIGLDIPKEELNKNIEKRLKKRIKTGMLEEIKHLHKQGVPWKRMEALGLEYRYGSRYIRGLINKEEFIETLNAKIRQYAKRQRTWWRKDKKINWFKPTETVKVYRLVEKFLKTSEDN